MKTKQLIAFLLFTSGAAMAEPVNVNQADAETLSKSLKGIGPKKAEAIVQYRKEHGDFKSLKDFENVKGIGAKTIQVNEKDILLTPGVETQPVAQPKEDVSKKK